MGLTLEEMCSIQREQQAELGVAPSMLTDVERRETARDLVLCLQEYASDLQKASLDSYKGHFLSERKVEGDANVCDALVDMVKIALSIADLHGVTAQDFQEAFKLKARIVSAKASGRKKHLQTTTKVVCVDLDDVVADLSAFRASLGARIGDAPAQLALEASEAAKEAWYAAGGFRELPPVEGAVDGLQELRDMGCRIVYVTARPQWQYKRIAGDTVWWLDSLSLPHDLVLYGKDKLELLYNEVRPAWPLAFVEDHERNAKHLAAAGVPVLLFDRPHNQALADEKNLTRVYGWSDVVDRVSSAISARPE